LRTLLVVPRPALLILATILLDKSVARPEFRIIWLWLRFRAHGRDDAGAANETLTGWMEQPCRKALDLPSAAMLMQIPPISGLICLREMPPARSQESNAQDPLAGQGPQR